jgi:hypothetical protein
MEEGEFPMPLTTTSTLVGFPDANSTGVRDGVTLRQVGNMTVTTPGAIISGLEIHGTLRIEADNVTVRDCKIVNEGGWHGILIPDGNTGAVVEFCDIIGPVNGISGTGTFRSNDFSSNDNGINVYGPSLIVDNYIHDMSGGADAHYDGIEINGGGGTTIRHNTIINDHDQTSAVMINNDFGAVPGIIIDNNYLAGGGYTIYSDGRFSSTDLITGVQITNNYLGQGYWGYFAFWNNTPLVSGNHELGRTWLSPSPGGNAVVSATLVNADTDLDIGLLMNDMVLDFSNLPAHLSVRANTDPSATGSVAFDLDGITHIENILPYAIAGDNQGDYNPWTPTVGMHTLVLTPYSGGDGTGQAGVPLAISFNVLPSSGNAVVSATLVDADTDTDIQPLQSGMTLNLAVLPTQNLSVRANTEPSSTGSVVFDFDGVTHIENILPYAIAGDFPQGDYTPWTPEAGSHSLVMTPYSGPAATGQPGAPLTIHFDILA